MNFQSNITALVTTSPIPSCPSTEIISQAYEGIRRRLPDIPVVVLIDGVHPDQQRYRPQYDEYKERLRALQWRNTEFVEFSEYTHQLEMTRQAFSRGYVKTPLVLWHEHDWELLPNIEWDKI